LAAGERSMTLGDAETAVVWANEALKQRPGDRAASDLLARAQTRVAVAVPPRVEAVPPAAPSVEVTGPPPKIYKQQISVSGDFLLGQGRVSLPIGYSLEKAISIPGVDLHKGPALADRSSTYFGGTISYSYGESRAFYVDLSYAQGQSSGSQDIDTLGLGSIRSEFSIDDTWYQAYARYAFPFLRG